MRNTLTVGDSIWVDSLYCEGYFRFDSVGPVVLPDTIVQAIRGRDFIRSSDTASYWFAENIGMVQCETNISAFCTGRIPESGWTARLKLLSSNLLGQSGAEKAKAGQSAALCAYPNPFNPETHILYGGSESADLKIFNINGKLVKAGFFNGSAGFIWDGRDGQGRPLPAGVYLARVTAGGKKAQIRLLLTR